MTKVALLMPEEFDQAEIEFIEHHLGEVVGPWTAGVDVTLALSRIPSGKFFAWDRPFKKENLNWMEAESLEELVRKIKEVANEHPERYS